MIVNYKRSGIHNAHGTVLMPGVNRVDTAKWSESRLHPMVQMAIENGDIVEEQDFEDAAGLTETEAELAEDQLLLGLKIPQAKQLIEETIDLKLLARWKAAEKRNQLIGVINKQVEKLLAPAEERDRDAVRQISTGKGPIEINVANPGDRE